MKICQTTRLKTKRKPKKIWVVKSSEFYNKSMKPQLEENATEMYSTHNEKRLVVAEIFIKTLRNKTCKYMTSISENVFIEKL